jgi:hypothetical protein
MNRLTAVSVLALVLAGACQDISPDRARPTVAGPSFQEGPPSDAECRGALTGRFNNVVVPAGADCVLTNSILEGNLTALEGSSLATHNNTIAGNVQADKARGVNINGSSVGGNIDIVGGEAPFGTTGFLVSSVTLTEGNINLKKNRGSVRLEVNTLDKGDINVTDNTIPLPGPFFEDLLVLSNRAGKIKVYRNTGAGPKYVFDNFAGHSLHCVGNDEPFTGGPNTDTPKAKGQCFTTTPPPPPGPAEPPPGEQ